MDDRKRAHSARRRIVLLLLLAAIVVWQTVQAAVLGSLGIPGLFAVAVRSPNEPAATPAGKPRMTVVPKTAFRKRLKQAGGPSRESEAGGVSAPEGDREAAQPPATSSPDTKGLPPEAVLKRWIGSRAREFVGGVDAEGNILYRFDVWLEAPADLRPRVSEVVYRYDAPSARPAQQGSKNRADDFRVKFGALSCSQNVTVTLTYEDGRRQSVSVNGCGILR